jgi:hypothetical protein
MTDLESTRYAVISVAEEADATELCGHHGKLIDRFRSEESARALALQRMAFGDVGVVVIDAATGSRVFPPPEATESAHRRIGRQGLAAEHFTRRSTKKDRT